MLTTEKIRDWIGTSLLSALWILLAWSLGTIVLDRRQELVAETDGDFRPFFPPQSATAVLSGFKARILKYDSLLAGRDAQVLTEAELRDRVLALRSEVDRALIRDSVTLAGVAMIAVGDEQVALAEAMLARARSERQFWQRVWDVHGRNNIIGKGSVRELTDAAELQTISWEALHLAFEASAKSTTERMRLSLARLQRANKTYRLAKGVLAACIVVLAALFLYSRKARAGESKVAEASSTDGSP